MAPGVGTFTERGQKVGVSVPITAGVKDAQARDSFGGNKPTVIILTARSSAGPVGMDDGD